MLDFNIRSEDDPLFVNSYCVNNNLDCFLQEIDLVINTIKQSVLFKRDFGADIEQYLWHTSANSSRIESIVKEQIEKNSQLSQYFKWIVTFTIIQGTGRDIGVLDVFISDKQNNEPLASQRYVLR